MEHFGFQTISADEKVPKQKLSRSFSKKQYRERVNCSPSYLTISGLAWHFL